jgi:hypothetical protein
MSSSVPVLTRLSIFLLVLAVLFSVACGAGPAGSTPPPVTPPPTEPPPTTTPPPTNTGVFQWKGDHSGSGNYLAEAKLTPANVNVTQFGKLGDFTADGNVLAQPLYVAGMTMADGAAHNIVIVATEHNSVYAFDADKPGTAAIWERHYNVNGATSAPDNYGGRTSIGGEIGITGTPVIDPSTMTVYFVTMQSVNGGIHQYLRAVSLKDGKDFGPGTMEITASVDGDGRGSVNGKVPFDPGIQNQRPGLTLVKGKVIIAWGSFSDWGTYHGWVMAYDAATLAQSAVFNTANQYQSQDAAEGPADHGGGASIWGGGASPSVDADGNVWVVGADGSFNADQGGTNYGDSVLKLKFDGSSFQVADYYTPSNANCIDAADLEIGSGGVALLADRGNALSINKEGKLFILNVANLGHYSATSDAPQIVKVASNECTANMGTGFAEGPDWHRLYGNVSYWNNNVYVAVSSGPLSQFQFTGAALGSQPFKQSSTIYGMRGGNTVVSSNAASNAIVWAYNKNATEGRAELHAYDATDVSKELWNSGMNAGRDQMGPGFGFGVPMVYDGRVFAATGFKVTMYGLLK